MAYVSSANIIVDAGGDFVKIMNVIIHFEKIVLCIFKHPNI